jgi:hypothetical protein
MIFRRCCTRSHAGWGRGFAANWQRRFKPTRHHVAGAGNHTPSSTWRAINGCRTPLQARSESCAGLRCSTIRVTSRQSARCASASSRRRYVTMCVPCRKRSIRNRRARYRRHRDQAAWSAWHSRCRMLIDHLALDTRHLDGAPKRVSFAP